MATNESSRVERARLRGIYAIVNEGEPDPTGIARAALGAGVRLIQYRAKGGIVAERLRQLREDTLRYDALLIVNDDWRAAIVFDCDGVHLGPGDDGFASVAAVRRALGRRAIGLSCGTVEEARLAGAADVDYIGVGSVYATASKIDAGAPIGLEGLRRVAAVATVPVAAIGGISAENITEVRATGVAMAAVISAISAAPNPGAAASGLVSAWNSHG